MTDAVLIIGTSSSQCGNCHQQVLPDNLKHDTVSGYGPERPGCGATFTAITTGYGFPDELLQSMRPDLPVISWAEYVTQLKETS